jgi:hypothetical protein
MFDTHRKGRLATHESPSGSSATNNALLLCDLLDAHASVLRVADGARANGLDTSTDRNFAIGSVVLTNDLQSYAVGEQLTVLQM